MKTFTYMFAILILSMSGCSSQKKMVAETPFEMGQATCQAWLGGRPETGSGMLLEIPILGENMDEMKLQQAFFRGKIADIKLESTDNGWVAKANFIKKGIGKPDMVMHSDSGKEVGNEPPSLKQEFPFELEKNQCVVSFLDGDTLKYFKVENIKEKKTKMFK